MSLRLCRILDILCTNSQTDYIYEYVGQLQRRLRRRRPLGNIRDAREVRLAYMKCDSYLSAKTGRGHDGNFPSFLDFSAKKKIG